ncbi:MAG: hypothetical protein E2O37_11480 [Proteobacteria bacterium]|nr:MAG: hypothetical protein E2O37_11480 [Pseudomonadota bacterium]TDJ72460.1 MAG: hypothetical protein E2O38_04735 [Pseudomonadota bacterium]
MSISQTDAWMIVDPTDPRTTQITNVGLAMSDGTRKQGLLARFMFEMPPRTRRAEEMKWYYGR